LVALAKQSTPGLGRAHSGRLAFGRLSNAGFHPTLSTPAAGRVPSRHGTAQTKFN
jgi:hypothetical protein